jgi:cbb3-type cytochrome oxidase maturation protein
MEVLVFLVPLALLLGLVGLAGFLWSLKNGQYDDLDGAAWRAIATMSHVAEDTARSAQWSPQCRRAPASGPNWSAHASASAKNCQ